jgi:16S rRNA (guanine527-N7)-methyltransferase
VSLATELRPGLQAGLAQLGLELAEAQVTQLLAYAELLAKWNKVYNLTALREPKDMLSHHLLDCLAVVPALQQQLQNAGWADRPLQCLDVGAGGGLPGVVLAICFPAITVHCVDAVAKKAAFVQQVALALGLPNLHGLHARVENLGPSHQGRHQIVSSRAFAALSDFVGLTQGCLAPDGLWLAMKGKHPQSELDALALAQPGVQVFHVEQLAVPGLAAERCIVWAKRRVA